MDVHVGEGNLCGHNDNGPGAEHYDDTHQHGRLPEHWTQLSAIPSPRRSGKIIIFPEALQFDHKLISVCDYVTQYCKKILAPISIAMIVFIIVFGTYANLYMFKLMNAAILFSAGLCVWSGFVGGFLVSTVLRFSNKDRIAISIETGIQNTGIAIVLLGVSLPPPDNDISSVVPVAASIMTPIPLTLVWIVIKCRSWYRKRQGSLSLRTDEAHRTISNSSSSTLISAGVNNGTKIDPGDYKSVENAHTA